MILINSSNYTLYILNNEASSDFSSCTKNIPSLLFKNVTKWKWPTARTGGLLDRKSIRVSEPLRTGTHTLASPSDNVSRGLILLFPRHETTGCWSGSAQIKCAHAYVCAIKLSERREVAVQKGHRMWCVSIKQNELKKKKLNNCLFTF